MAAISSLSSPNLLLKPSNAAAIRKISSLRVSPFAGSGICLGSALVQPLLGQRSRGRLCVVAQEASTAVREASSDVARRLYVGNIPRNLKNDELSAIFGEHGSVDKAEIMYDKYSGRSRRFAFVTMSSVEDANAAIEKLDGSEIGGRKIKVNVTEKPLQPLGLSLLQSDESTFVDSPFKVYVGNLSKSVTSAVLTEFFSERGKVVSAKVSRTPGASKSTGFGFVSFSSEEDVDAAILSANNAFLEGQRIRVNKA